MATEAQRLIGISLAKIAQSRCGRGGVSLHKNLLVATVLQKARFIFMEEAYHMVHGHYLQANKFLEPDIDIRDDPNDTVDTDSMDDCELDDIFDAPSSSIGKDADSSEDFTEELCENKENSPPEPTNYSTNKPNNGLIYLDLDKHIQKPSSQTSANNTNNNQNESSCVSNGNNKRRREITEWETEEAVLSILPKKIKSDSTSLSSESESSCDDEIFLSERITRSQNENIDDESDNNAAINLSLNVSRELELDELNNNNNNNSNNVTNNNNNSSSNNNNLSENGPSMEGIDRITSLVSIFSFGNLTRSVSTPDLCSAQATKDSCGSESSLSQRTYLAMTV